MIGTAVGKTASTTVCSCERHQQATKATHLPTAWESFLGASLLLYFNKKTEVVTFNVPQCWFRYTCICC
jgi:hypothetical protein